MENANVIITYHNVLYLRNFNALRNFLCAIKELMLTHFNFYTWQLSIYPIYCQVLQCQQNNTCVVTQISYVQFSLSGLPSSYKKFKNTKWKTLTSVLTLLSNLFYDTPMSAPRRENNLIITVVPEHVAGKNIKQEFHFLLCHRTASFVTNYRCRNVKYFISLLQVTRLTKDV